MTATTTAVPTAPIESLGILMRALKLPAFSRYAEEVAQKAEREGWTFGQYLHHLAELEVHERRRRRTERFLKAADLPPEKTLATLTRARLPPKVAKMLPTLCETTSSRSGCRAAARRTSSARSATSSFSAATAFSSLRRSR
jgi:DNA replication protein DnaC